MIRREGSRGAAADAARAPEHSRQVRPGRAWERAANLAVVAVAAAWLVRLGVQGLAARLQTDECFHALMSEWIAAHGTLPRTIPALYSGFGYFYPPLYHFVGAAAVAAFGAPGFKLVNVALSGALLVSIVIAFRRMGSGGAARWAVCLCVANAFLSLHAVRMYVEQLTVALGVPAVLMIAIVHRDARRRDAILLGVLAGLAVLAKLSSLVLLAAVLGLAILHALRGRRDRATAFGLAGGIALVVAAPMFVRNHLLYGSAIYPALAHDLHPLLYRLNQARFTPAPSVYYASLAGCIGPAIGTFVVAALAVAVAHRRAAVELWLLVACAGLALAGPLQTMLDVRHVLPVIVAMGVLGAAQVGEALASRRSMAKALDVAMIGLAAYSVATMEDFRLGLDEPRQMDAAFQAVRDHVPEGETILSLYTYDTLYYTRRASTWPIPYGQKHPPFEMFMTSNPDSVLAAFHQHGLRYVLLVPSPESVTFDGTNYPRPFLGCVERLLADGRAVMLWRSSAAALVEVPDSAAPGAPAPVRGEPAAKVGGRGGSTTS